MKKEKALIIFAKNLIYGKVKTRLAATTGNEQAYQVYAHLLNHTQGLTQTLDLEKFVFFSDFIENDHRWNTGFYKYLQQGHDLGERMEHAFRLLTQAHDKVIIIGTDCPGLTTEMIEEGFECLNKVDVVIGPACDGGYYLLGMKKMHAFLFHGITWSTPAVFDETIKKCEEQGLTYSLLSRLPDIDQEADLIHLKAYLPAISIIIPTYNEADQIAQTIQRIHEARGEHGIEVIVADGGSTDGTCQAATRAGAKTLISPRKGRSAQMNFGASAASASILYFLHADTIPPKGFSFDIVHAIHSGNKSGCFMLAFDHRHWFLKAHCWFTRFDLTSFRFGDQSLFVDAAVFKKINGFNENMIVMEDQEIIPRLRKEGNFKIIKKPVTTSARKYLLNGVYKTQSIFYLIYVMYRFGFSQERLLRTYKKMIIQDKI